MKTSRCGGAMRHIRALGGGPRRLSLAVPGRGWASRFLLLGWLPGWACLLACVLTPAGCAKSGDVEQLRQEGRVRDARVQALEQGMTEAVRKQIAQLTEQMEALQRSIDARYAALNERIELLVGEQARISEGEETNRAQFKKHERRDGELLKAQAVAVQEQVSELDKLRLRIQDMERLLRSPLADLPAGTEADKAYREAHFFMISGQLDLAADKFAQFVQSYPADKRRPEALLRQGQSYFMLRKYDFALAPLYELVDKSPNGKAAPEGRWYIARALEETGDLKLARDFYAQLVVGKTVYAADAARRVALIQKLALLPPQEAAKPARNGPAEPARDKASAPRNDTEARPGKPAAADKG
jgi:TolA-binding protein